MNLPSETLTLNARILKSKVNRYALYGVVISLVAILTATLLTSYLESGEISLDSLLKAQKSNLGLWFLDMMPFLFAFLGQYMGTMMAYEAGALLTDQTQELREQTQILEKKAAYDATHDALTDLPNRTLFHDRVAQAIRNAKRENSQLALVLLDLDRFKEINDTMGHYHGDRLLKQVAMRLETTIRESDTLARLGGDEFAVLLPAIKNEEAIVSVSKKIQNALHPPFILEGLSIDVQASMGAVSFPDHGDDADTLIQRADVAMYLAKQEGKGLVIYSEKMDQHSPHRLTLLGELRQAIENDHVLLHFQPKVDAANRKVTGAEALVRWNHPLHGLMSPEAFISLAERTGVIKPLTRWVMKHALHQGLLWHSQGIDIGISVNLSTKNLLDPDFPDIVAGLLASCTFPPRSLTLEITETTIMADPERAMETLKRIVSMGVKFSIDDFGTGYSSLAYLKKLPIGEIKIDKSFVSDMMNNENDAAIVHATIDLAHNLGHRVVAEGVETDEAMKHLVSLGCDEIQGFLISPPLDAREFVSWYHGSGWGKSFPEPKRNSA